jgi:hypothetical protein
VGVLTFVSGATVAVFMQEKPEGPVESMTKR